MRAWSKNGLDRLDELVARHVAVDGVPGAAWLVARDGEVHVGTAGSVDGSNRVQRDSIFRQSESFELAAVERHILSLRHLERDACAFVESNEAR